MPQRYFIAAEATYEILRQQLNTQLGYPNSLGQSIFHTPLQAPRDSFRRVLLAVDTSLPGYATVNAALAPLLSGNSVEELDEATYLTAVNSASGGGGVSSWNDLTDKPSTFPPTSHQHVIADTTGLQAALDSKQAAGSYASASHAHSASDTNSGVFDVARIPSLPASQIGSGTIATARLASGTANSTTFLAGDQTWKTVTSGSANASDLTSGTLSNNRLTARARAAVNLFNWSSFR